MTARGPAKIVNDRPILSSERILLKHYDRKGLVEKKLMTVSLEGLGAKMN
jgi:hypothetical protein